MNIIFKGDSVKRQLFRQENRAEVLALYRDLMKKTARALPRRLEREAKLAEFRYIMRECQFEEDPD